MLHHSNIKSSDKHTPFEVLLIEDHVGDVRLISEAIKDTGSSIKLTVVSDGKQAMDFLYKNEPYTNAITPDLILLDLNIPKKDGRAVLAEIKYDPRLKRIPVIVLTISQAEEDIVQCYNLHANCYITKPFEIDQVIALFKAIHLFWFTVVTLPPKKDLEKNDN